jgi:hypothetical protein
MNRRLAVVQCLLTLFIMQCARHFRRREHRRVTHCHSATIFTKQRTVLH